MAKYLIMIPPHFGHIYPTLGWGHELICRGHEVVWIGLSEIDDTVFPVGGTFMFPPEFRQYKEEIAHIFKRENEGTNITSNKMIQWSFESVWLPLHDIMMDGIEQVIRREQPDLIVHDEGLKAVAVAAHLLRIPYVTSISSVPGLHCPNTSLMQADDLWVQAKMNAILEEHSIHTPVFNSPLLNLVYSSESFCSEASFPNQYSFVGPMVSGRPSADKAMDIDFEKIATPIVYVSIGTLLKDIKKAFFSKVVEALENLPMTVLLSVDPDVFEKWPSNFIPQSHWSQLGLLPKVDVVVSHGGFNTVNETLYFGKPMLIIPLSVDQFNNARLVERSGCGLKLRYRRLTASQLRDGVLELLKNGTIQEAAQNVSEGLKAAGGVKTAADQIENAHMSIFSGLSFKSTYRRYT